MTVDGWIAGLTLASDGAIYGTTITGGQFGQGSVFKLSPALHMLDGLARATVGNAFSYRLARLKDTERFSVSGLPPGLVLDPVTGVISGTPLVCGAFSGTVTVSNRFGGINASLMINVSPIVSWGANESGQCTTPIGLCNTIAIAAGHGSLALRQDGTVAAWGGIFVPNGLTNVTAISAGFQHSLALKQNGTVVAWGDNGSGQTDVPTGLINAVAIAAGDWHSLALKQDGTVVAWGYNWGGQTNVPTGLTDAISIAGGNAHSLALKRDGTVIAWGSNYYGQTNVPTGLTNVTAIAAGSAHNLALKQDGTVVAWGDNYFYGQTNVPTGLSNVVAIAAGYWHNLALKQDGTVVAWGGNWADQSSVPIQLTNVIAIAAGYWHSVALVRQPRPPTAFARISSQLRIRLVETNLFFLAANNSVAAVVLDGAQSSDADGDPLQFFWYADGQAEPLATGVLATNRFSVGTHTVTLVVSDGYLTATDQVKFEVITPAVAVGQLVQLLDNAELGTRNRQPLLATLLAARSSFDRGDFNAALNQLSAFQNKVRSQVAPWNFAVAEQFTASTQQIITVVKGD